MVRASRQHCAHGALVVGDEDGGHAGFGDALAELGAQLDMEIVAEGIETAGERTVLSNLNVDFGQGFLLGRPATADSSRRSISNSSRRPASEGCSRRASARARLPRAAAP